MRVVLLVAAILTSMALAAAQTSGPLPQDLEITVYRQLLDQSNAQLANAAAQLIQANNKIKELEEKLDQLKIKEGKNGG